SLRLLLCGRSSGSKLLLSSTRVCVCVCGATVRGIRGYFKSTSPNAKLACMPRTRYKGTGFLSTNHAITEIIEDARQRTKKQITLSHVMTKSRRDREATNTTRPPVTTLSLSLFRPHPG
ncbi:unnamed protein product, partial [Ectocarpus sp. 4 AP-2014]